MTDREKLIEAMALWVPGTQLQTCKEVAEGIFNALAAAGYTIIQERSKFFDAESQTMFVSGPKVE